MRLLPAGDSALLLEWEEAIDPAVNDRVLAYQAQLEAQPLPGVVELVPSYRSLLVIYDPWVTSREELGRQLANFAVAPHAQRGRTVSVLVRYGATWGPDLPALAAHARLTPQEVIALHCAPTYRVYMIGFAPGYPYLGGLDPRLGVPRLAQPRTAVPAGSVAIGGQQTGIYPLTSPGGWWIIGRTELKLFDPTRDPPALLSAGDSVRFVAVESPS